MRGAKIKHIAALITISRIIGSVSLLFIKPLSMHFYIVFSLCGISDVLDGYIARRTNTAGKPGAILDSIADFMLVVVMLILFAPMLSWEGWQIFWILIIALIRCTSLLVGFVKYRSLTFLHTYANKITGFTLFCFPFLLHIANLTITIVIICGIASLSATEELIINIKSKNLNRDAKSIFSNGIGIKNGH